VVAAGATMLAVLPGSGVAGAQVESPGTGAQADPFAQIPASIPTSGDPVLVNGVLDRAPTDAALRMAIDEAATARVDAYVEDFDGTARLVPVAWTTTDSSGRFELRLDPSDLPPTVSPSGGRLLNVRLFVSDPANGGFALHMVQARLGTVDGRTTWIMSEPATASTGGALPRAVAAVAAPVTIPVPVTGATSSTRTEDGSIPLASATGASLPSSCTPYIRPGGTGYYSINSPDAEIQFSHAMVEDVDSSSWIISSGLKQAKHVSATVQDGVTTSAGLGVDFSYLNLDFSGSFQLTGSTTSGSGGATAFSIPNLDSRKWGGTLNLKYYTRQPASLQLISCTSLVTFQKEPAFWLPMVETRISQSRGTIAKQGGYLARGNDGKYLAPCSANPNRAVQPVAAGLTAFRSSDSSVEYSNGYTFTYGNGLSVAGSGVRSETSRTRTTSTSRSAESWYEFRNPTQGTKYGCTTTSNSIYSGRALFFGLGSVNRSR
jgi:hypothetical protein